MVHVRLLIQRLTSHAKTLILVFPDAPPEFNVRHIKSGLALTNLFIQKPDEALPLLIVKLASGFIYGFRVFQRTCLFLIKPSLQAPLISLAGAPGTLMAEEIEADRQPAVQNLL